MTDTNKEEIGIYSEYIRYKQLILCIYQSIQCIQHMNFIITKLEYREFSVNEYVQA